MPEYDKDREHYDNNRRGRIFETGTEQYYRDRERGYTRDSRTFISPRIGTIKFDKTREVDGRVQAIEEKSGRIEGKKDEKQLKAVRDLLARGTVSQHVLRSVQGEAVSKTCQELIQGLTRDFPGQFNHQVISRADARQIWALGLQREQGQQLELPGVGEQARRQRHTRQQDRAREEREREERAHHAQQIAQQRQREAAERFARAAREAREAAERGQRRPFSARDIADLLAVSRPPPGYESPHREPPAAGSTRAGREERNRVRGTERER
ncbi:hypothetical protein AB0H71_03080 [Nocardia sp. NPDC050697]|uniref:hypothetical protein n=1 Tax=Nocardia sp. NPDC050697 TaxID=3155158 RepID=UPI003402BFD1